MGFEDGVPQNHTFSPVFETCESVSIDQNILKQGKLIIM
jgi:hypothetical protein